MKAIDIHHHFVPQQLLEETRRHGKALGVDVTESQGRYALSFAGGKPHGLQPGLLDIHRRIEIMDRGEIGMATLEANTNSLGYRLNAEQGQAWAKLYNDCVNHFVRQQPDRFVGMAIVPLQDPGRAAQVLDTPSSSSSFAASSSAPTSMGNTTMSKTSIPSGPRRRNWTF